MSCRAWRDEKFDLGAIRDRNGRNFESFSVEKSPAAKIKADFHVWEILRIILWPSAHTAKSIP